MKRITAWFKHLSKRLRDSITFAWMIIGALSTILSIWGISLQNFPNVNWWMGILIVAAVYIVIVTIIYFILGQVYKDSVKLTIRNTPVKISCGDIFKSPAWKVIGCDTHFDTRVDDVYISKSSLHGKLVLEHGNAKEINGVVEARAIAMNFKPDKDGLYSFPLGTVIRYDSSVDKQTYLMVAMTELNEIHEAHTNMAKYEQMLMRMWRQIDTLYARNDIALPLLGDGISRFDDGPKEKNELLHCMLCTLNSSGVTLKSNVNVILYRNAEDSLTETVPLYEYKNMFDGL